MKSNNPIGLEKKPSGPHTQPYFLLNGENNDTFPPFPLPL
jgi:hypothetical protein